MTKTRTPISFIVTRKLIHTFILAAYIDRSIHLLPKYEILNVKTSSVDIQFSLRQTLSEMLKICFLVMWLKYLTGMNFNRILSESSIAGD